MEIDKTTLIDLSIFNTEEEFSVFNKFNFCKTIGGKERLLANFGKPLSTIDEIKGIQQTLKTILQNQPYWPAQITNGTIMVIEKFYLTTIDEIPSNASALSAYNYKLFHAPDFSLVKYSVGYVFDFIKGMQEIVSLFLKDDAPSPLKKLLQDTAQILNKEQFTIIKNNTKAADLTNPQQLQLAHFVLYHYKQNILGLINIYSQLDAWYGMAVSVQQYNLVFPEFIQTNQSCVIAKRLYHILLPQPVAYDINLTPESNFLFLTGANMAGKSTFIKTIGAAIFLAHIGMGVPAQQMQLSLFDGLLSNINVADNIAKGESYFYNEVQRIKATINKIKDNRKWLILIDELFKGTNVQDAMKCSSVVIEGLLKIKNSLFILSTHLYEIGESLQQYPNISFNYFETSIASDQLHFSYQLKEGISNDRLGYFILNKEGVVELLQKL